MTTSTTGGGGGRWGQLEAVLAAQAHNRAAQVQAAADLDQAKARLAVLDDEGVYLDEQLRQVLATLRTTSPPPSPPGEPGP